MNDELLTAALRSYVVFSWADADAPTADMIADDVSRIRETCLIEMNIANPMSSSYRINFHDECDVTMIVFCVNETITSTLISLDGDAYTLI